MSNTQPCLPLEATVTVYVGDLPEFQKLGLEFATFTLEDYENASDAENFYGALERLDPKRLG